MARPSLFLRACLALLMALVLTGNGWAALAAHACCPAAAEARAATAAPHGMPCHGASHAQASPGTPVPLPGEPQHQEGACHPGLACAQCLSLPADPLAAVLPAPAAAAARLAAPAVRLATAPRASLWRPPIAS